MPERLDSVQIAYSRGTVAIPWSSRDALLAETRHLDSAKSIRDAFLAVGATRPVELKRDEMVLLLHAIDVWMGNVGGPDQLPAGIFNLRNALIDDTHDTAGGP